MFTIAQELKLNGVSVYLIPDGLLQNFDIKKYLHEQKEYISNVFRNISTDVINPLIGDVFTKKEMPAKPIISIHTRDARDTAKIIKTFYLKYPQYRWITFRHMRGIKQDDFSKFLKESFPHNSCVTI